MITQNYTKQLRNIHINIISKVELKIKEISKTLSIEIKYSAFQVFTTNWWEMIDTMIAVIKYFFIFCSTPIMLQYYWWSRSKMYFFFIKPKEKKALYNTCKKSAYRCLFKNTNSEKIADILIESTSQI